MLDHQMTDDPKKAGIPVFLQTQNRRPPTVEEQARIDAFFAAVPLPGTTVSRPALSVADLAAIAEIESSAKEKRAANSVQSRMARARERTERYGRWVPGCRWNASRARWEHPGAKWDRAKMAWIPKTGGAAIVPQQEAAANAPTRSPRTRVAGSKTLIIAALLKREQGCTTAEVLEACGWPSVSMPAQAKLAGLTLRKEKKPGEAMRYWGA